MALAGFRFTAQVLRAGHWSMLIALLAIGWRGAVPVKAATGPTNNPKAVTRLAGRAESRPSQIFAPDELAPRPRTRAGSQHKPVTVIADKTDPAQVPTKPKLEKIAVILNDLGNAVVDEIGALPKRAYLFAQVSGDWPTVRLFVDEGKMVRAQHLQGQVAKLVTKLWRTENKGRTRALRWVGFGYDLRGRKTTAEFVYPEQLQGGPDTEAWLDRALRKRFRNKPIVEIVDPQSMDPVI